MNRRKGNPPIGKVARLPFIIREELCQRLRDGQAGHVICAWLNSLPAVAKAIRHNFGDSVAVAVSENNLSEWKRIGYQRWLEKRERAEAQLPSVRI